MFKNLFNKNKKQEEAWKNNSANISNNTNGVENNGKGNISIAMVLLEDEVFDFERLRKDLSETWKLDIPDSDIDSSEGTYVFNVGTIMIGVSIVDAPYPDDLEFQASKNYMWPEAVSVTKEHKGHVMVTVLGEGTPTDKGILFTKVLDVCCNQENVVGIYYNDVVQKPDMFKNFAKIMGDGTEGSLPFINLVWVGFMRCEEGIVVYTAGLRFLGKDEMEIVSDVSANMMDLREAMVDLVGYVTVGEAVLLEGQTIGPTPDVKWPITKKEGIANEGMVLRIGYK